MVNDAVVSYHCGFMYCHILTYNAVLPHFLDVDHCLFLCIFEIICWGKCFMIAEI